MKFPDRLMRAIEAKRTTIPELAHRVGCTRAVLHKYRNGKSRTIEALLLFELADALEVSARWLLTGDGGMETMRDQQRAIESIRSIIDTTPKPQSPMRGSH